MGKNSVRIDEVSKIAVVNFQGDFKIGEKSDKSMFLTMPANFLAQSENFFVSTYRLAKDIKCEAELAEKGRMSYLWDVMIAIGGIFIGIWNIVPVSIGFVLILGDLWGTDSVIYIIVTGIFIHWEELTGSGSPFSEKSKKSMRARSGLSEKRCISEEYRELAMCHLL